MTHVVSASLDGVSENMWLSDIDDPQTHSSLQDSRMVEDACGGDDFEGVATIGSRSGGCYEGNAWWIVERCELAKVVIFERGREKRS